MSTEIENWAKKAPKLGENNEEILLQLGYTDEDIKSFKERKIIQ